MQFINTINGINKPEVSFRINMIFVATNVVLNLLLIDLIGWYGAAIATLISSVVWMVLCGIYLSRFVDVIIPIKQIAYQILASITMAAVLSGAKLYLPHNYYVTIGMIFLGALLYGTILIAVSGKVRLKAVSLLREVFYNGKGFIQIIAQVRIIKTCCW